MDASPPGKGNRDPSRVLGPLGAAVALVTASLGCTVERPVGTARSHVVDVTAIDCGPIIAAIKNRRGSSAHNDALAQAARLRTDSPHQDVPITDLVKFYAPLSGQGRPTEQWRSDVMEIFTRELLCDPLLHEIVSQHYVARHREYAL